MHGAKEKYGSVAEFVREERLGWKDTEVSKGEPFQDPGMWHFT